MRGEDGQATVEWVGLVLLAALVLGALAAFSGPRKDGPELGGEIAERITCTARDLCGAAKARRGGPAAPTGGEPGAPTLGAAAPPAPGPGASPTRGGAAPPAPGPSGAPPVGVAQAANAFQRLRGVAWIAKRAWIVCLGYKRWRYELAHPRVLNEPLPVKEALRIANGCLNPYSFIGKD